jgi:aspartate aminotransferase/aminotransferase
MTSGFRAVEGGLFGEVSKADVGDVASNLARQGIDLMAWADPFFPDPTLPAPVAEAMIQSIQSGEAVHYTMPIGSPALKREIARKLASYNGLVVDPERNILITPGSDSGLLFAMMPFLSPGDEVLVPDPSYPSNFLNPSLLGAVCVPFPLDAVNGYRLDVTRMAEKLTDKTKMVLLSHPNNPTSTVFDPDSLTALSRFVTQHDLILVCDQAFEDFIYDGREFITPAALPGMWERTVSVFSLSKGYGLSGLRVGYLVADDHIMDTFYGSAVNVIGATNTAAQAGALAAFRHPEILAEYRERLNRRRDMAYEAFSGIPGVGVRPSESGFLSWLDVSALGDSKVIVSHLTQNAKVLVNDGAAYGRQGAGHIRIVHGCFRDDDRARHAFLRIRRALCGLSEESVPRPGR